jgi:DNA-binding response OmpR family regulator
VLIVEDDADLRLVLATVLRSEGFDPVSAMSAEDGLSLLEGESYGLAVLDMRLPGMSGTKALAAIRESGPRMRVLAMSASAEFDDDVVRAAGAVSFLRKPFSAQMFVNRIKEVLGRDSLPEAR